MRWKPTLAGSLAIFNGLSWLCLFLLVRLLYKPIGDGLFGVLCIAWVFVLALPAAWFWLLFPALDHSPTLEETIQFCVVLGVNALLWGRGLAAILRRTTLVPIRPAPGEPTPQER